MIIGITGPIGHGKTTLANAFEEIEPTTVHFESFLLVAEVVDALHARLKTVPDASDTDALNEWLHSLPDILRQTLHVECTFDQLKLDPQAMKAQPVNYEKLLLHIHNLKAKPSLLKQKITHDNKPEYRPILQWLGGYLVQRLKKDTWYEELVRRAQESGRTGAKLCVISGIRFPAQAETVKKAGGKIIKIVRPGLPQADLTDPTERERENIAADITIINDGSLEDLRRTAQQVFHDLAHGNQASSYKTKSI